MSKLDQTKKAYDKITALLDQEIRKKTGSTKELQELRQVVDVAFYLLGWGQFEYLVRKETEACVDAQVTTKGIDKHAWQYLKENVRSVTVRKRLDLVFHSKAIIRNQLDKEYTVRNEAAHNYKDLPPDARDVSAWLQKLEQIVDQFD